MVMHAIQIRSFAALQSSDSKPSKTLNTLATLFSAVEEGFNKAEHYEALTRKSDDELAARGLRREDLARLAMFGKA
jgi:uncharacterized protein YjiS (DUF1127 family)